MLSTLVPRLIWCHFLISIIIPTHISDKMVWKDNSMWTVDFDECFFPVNISDWRWRLSQYLCPWLCMTPGSAKRYALPVWDPPFKTIYISNMTFIFQNMLYTLVIIYRLTDRPTDWPTDQINELPLKKIKYWRCRPIFHSVLFIIHLSQSNYILCNVLLHSWSSQLELTHSWHIFNVYQTWYETYPAYLPTSLPTYLSTHEYLPNLPNLAGYRVVYY